MTRQAFGGAVLLVIAMQLLLEAGLQAQAPQLAGGTAASPKSAAVTVTMTECEGINDCATWTFLGAQGNGKWPSGEEANLAVEKYDATSVVIRRADSTGASAGLTAVYSGTRHGDRVGGDFTSSWPGHWDNKTGNWYATVGSPVALPSVFHTCGGDHCFTYLLQDGKYTNYTNLPYQHDEKRIVTVKSFTRESVSLSEIDYGSYPLTAEWTGQISAEGNSIVNGVARITSWAGKPTHNPTPIPFQMTWGTVLDSIAGSDDQKDGSRGVQRAQQPVVVVAPVVCVPWFFTVICAQ